MKFDNDNFKLIELLEAQSIKCGHMFDENDKLTKRIYSELDGFNMVQLFNLSNGKGSNKDSMTKVKKSTKK